MQTLIFCRCCPYWNFLINNFRGSRPPTNYCGWSVYSLKEYKACSVSTSLFYREKEARRGPPLWMCFEEASHCLASWLLPSEHPDGVWAQHGALAMELATRRVCYRAHSIDQLPAPHQSSPNYLSALFRERNYSCLVVTIFRDKNTTDGGQRTGVSELWKLRERGCLLPLWSCTVQTVLKRE